MEYTYIPTGIKREMVRSGVEYNSYLYGTGYFRMFGRLINVNCLYKYQTAYLHKNYRFHYIHHHNNAIKNLGLVAQSDLGLL